MSDKDLSGLPVGLHVAASGLGFRQDDVEEALTSSLAAGFAIGRSSHAKVWPDHLMKYLATRNQLAASAWHPALNLLTQDVDPYITTPVVVAKDCIVDLSYLRKVRTSVLFFVHCLDAYMTAAGPVQDAVGLKHYLESQFLRLSRKVAHSITVGVINGLVSINIRVSGQALNFKIWSWDGKLRAGLDSERTEELVEACCVLWPDMREIYQDREFVLDYEPRFLTEEQFHSDLSWPLACQAELEPVVNLMRWSAKDNKFDLRFGSKTYRGLNVALPVSVDDFVLLKGVFMVSLQSELASRGSRLGSKLPDALRDTLHFVSAENHRQALQHGVNLYRATSSDDNFPVVSACGAKTWIKLTEVQAMRRIILAMIHARIVAESSSPPSGPEGFMDELGWILKWLKQEGHIDYFSIKRMVKKIVIGLKSERIYVDASLYSAKAESGHALKAIPALYPDMAPWITSQGTILLKQPMKPEAYKAPDPSTEPDNNQQTELPSNPA